MLAPMKKISNFSTVSMLVSIFSLHVCVIGGSSGDDGGDWW